MKYKGIHISLIIALFDSFTLVKCGLSMNHLPAILQEFKINHPAIADTILHKKETIKLLKILSVNLLRPIGNEILIVRSKNVRSIFLSF